MAESKANDNQLLCKMAIEDVNNKISIKFPQYPQFGQKFQAHCIDEAFEEIDVLIDDVAEGFSESVILEAVSEDMEIKDNDKEPLCSSIHYILTNFSPPPTSLNLVEIATKVQKKDVISMKETVKKQAILLKPDNMKDEALLKLLVVGQNNHFPLLTYLIDTYVRYRLLEYQKLYRELSTIEVQKKRTKFVAKKFNHVVELAGFFKNCHAMKKIRIKSRDDAQSEKALLWYDSSMKSFFRRLFGPLKMTPQQMIYKINDNISIFGKYYIGILCAVNNILQNAMTKVPQQIDFWVIPKAMSNTQSMYDNDNDDEDDDEYKSGEEDDDDIEEDSDDDDKGNNDNKITEINNLEQRLKYTDNLIIKDIDGSNMEISKLSRFLFSVYQDVVKHERSKRMVIIIDRRINRKDTIENNINYSNNNNNDDDDEQKDDTKDKLYAFLPKKSQNIPDGHYLHESMFNLSRLEVLPSENGRVAPDQDNNAIHVTSDLLNMCLLSIQIHEESVIRAYWYINHSATRFYVNDMINIWPLYFVENEFNKKDENDDDDDQPPKYQNVDKIKNMIQINKQNIPLKDANFDKFFEENTKIKPYEAYYDGVI